MGKVGVIMGSKSDLPVMQDAIDILKGFDIEVEVDIVSAHRTPEKLFDYGKNACGSRCRSLTCDKAALPQRTRLMSCIRCFTGKFIKVFLVTVLCDA